MADAILARGTGRPAAVGSPSLAVTVDGDGDPLGAVVGTHHGGGQHGGRRRGGGLDGQRRPLQRDRGPGSQLHTPEEPDNTQTGWWVRTRRGSSTRIVRQTYIPYGNAGQYDFTTAAGEELRLDYTVPEDGTLPHFVLTVVTGPLGEATTVWLHQANAAPDVSIQRAAFSQLQGEVSHLETEFANIHNQPSGPSVPQVTQAEAEAGSGTFSRLYTPQRVNQQVAAQVDAEYLARVLGGYGLSFSVSGNTLSIVQVNSDGTRTTLTFTPTPPSGGGGFTEDQIKDFAGALVSQLPRIHYDPATDRLTEDAAPPAPRPTNITLAELHHDLQALIKLAPHQQVGGDRRADQLRGVLAARGSVGHGHDTAGGVELPDAPGGGDVGNLRRRRRLAVRGGVRAGRHGVQQPVLSRVQLANHQHAGHAGGQHELEPVRHLGQRLHLLGEQRKRAYRGGGGQSRRFRVQHLPHSDARHDGVHRGQGGDEGQALGRRGAGHRAERHHRGAGHRDRGQGGGQIRRQRRRGGSP